MAELPRINIVIPETFAGARYVFAPETFAGARYVFAPEPVTFDPHETLMVGNEPRKSWGVEIPPELLPADWLNLPVMNGKGRCYARSNFKPVLALDPVRMGHLMRLRDYADQCRLPPSVVLRGRSLRVCVGLYTPEPGARVRGVTLKPRLVLYGIEPLGDLQNFEPILEELRERMAPTDADD